MAQLVFTAGLAGSGIALMTAAASLDLMAAVGGWAARGPLPSTLLRMHRDDRTHVLVTGGTASRRAAVARAFHDESPVRSGPLFILDCSRDTTRLDEALACWLSVVRRDSPDNPLRAVERGTLFLDQIDQLDHRLQRRLLGFACALSDGTLAQWAGRLTTGSTRTLEEAVAGGRLLPALFDCLDQVRIALAPVHPEERFS